MSPKRSPVRKRKPPAGRARPSGPPPPRAVATSAAAAVGEPWWERLPARLTEELASLVAGGDAPQRDRDAERAGILRLLVDLPTADGPVPAAVVYPDEFPYFRPYVTALGLGLGHHWSPSTGEVCLLEKAGDAWSTASTAAALLDSQWAEVLRLNGLSARGPADGADVSARETVPGPGAGGRPGEVDQAEPFTAYLDKTVPVVVVVPGGVAPPDGVGGGTARLLFRERGGAAAFQRAASGRAGPGLVPLPIAFLVALADSNGNPVWGNADGIVPLHPDDADALDIAWTRVREQPATADPAELWASAGGAAATGRGDRRVEILLMALPEETALRTPGVGWALLARSRPGGSAPWSAPAAGQVFRAGTADLRVRAPALDSIDSKRLLIVGAGGLGSALAGELARTCPAALTVLDGDVVDPATSVRAPAAWRTAGMAKPFALALLALEASPYTTVEGLGRRIGLPRLGPAQSDPDQCEALWQAVQAADVVVDATADFGVQQMLSDMCAASRTLFVMAQATVGVHGGTVAAIAASAVATGGGCWHCLMRHLDDESVPRPPASPAPLVQSAGCAEPTYTGAGFDLAVLASHAARVVVSALTGSSGYGTFADPVHVASLRGPGGEPVPAAWTSHPLDRHPECRQPWHPPDGR